MNFCNCVTTRKTGWVDSNMLKYSGSNGAMHKLRQYIYIFGEAGRVHASHDLRIMHDKSVGGRSSPVFEARSSIEEHTTSGALRDDVSHYRSVVWGGLCSVAEAFDYDPRFPGHCLSEIPNTTSHLSFGRLYTSAQKEKACSKETLHAERGPVLALYNRKLQPPCMGK
jgi:hypothetical protein